MATYIRGTSTTSGLNIRITTSGADWIRARKYLDKYQGIYAQKYVKKVLYAAARTQVTPMKAVLPVVTGNLRKSVKARQNMLRSGEMAASTVGPRAPHRYLYIVGSKEHSLEGGVSKYRPRAGKSKYSVFPGRGKTYKLKSFEKITISGTVANPRANRGTMYIAYNPWLTHPGTDPHVQLNTVWQRNKPRMTSFVQREMDKMHLGGFTGIGVNFH